MSSTPAPAAETFRTWLARELRREAKLSAVFLAAGVLVVLVADKSWSGFAGLWARLNHQLTYTALEQHPIAMLDAFGERLSHTEYGWGVFSWSEPFNVTAARARLHADFPEFLGVGADGQPVTVRSSVRRRSADHDARAAAYLARLRLLESRRFSRLYPTENPMDLPDATNRLARIVTKIIGLPDALLEMLRRIVNGGIACILLCSGTFALALVALWQARRPARIWLKLLVAPVLASALMWAAIVLMSIAAVLFGAFTVNTSALAILGGAPLLYLAAKAPLRLAEDLAFKPKPWDGVERRRANRPPQPTAPVG